MINILKRKKYIEIRYTHLYFVDSEGLFYYKAPICHNQNFKHLISLNLINRERSQIMSKSKACRWYEYNIALQVAYEQTLLFNWLRGIFANIACTWMPTRQVFWLYFKYHDLQVSTFDTFRPGSLTRLSIFSYIFFIKAKLHSSIRYPSTRYPFIRYPSIRYPSIRYPSIRYPVPVFSTMPFLTACKSCWHIIQHVIHKCQ